MAGVVRGIDKSQRLKPQGAQSNTGEKTGPEVKVRQWVRVTMKLL
jgi:hypothetical protein